MSTPTIQPSCAVTRRWEEASASLATTLTAYLEACLSLETKYKWASGASMQVVDLIDSKLDALHSVMDKQLSQSRSTLARTRNRLVSPAYRLPGEILSNIFLNALYLPDPDHSKFARIDDRLPAIYRNLHSLSGVCLAWREIAINYPALWSVIPVYDPIQGSSVYHATELSLQRAGNGPCHLAAVVSSLAWWQLELLSNSIHRFHSLNIHTETYSSIGSILQTIINHVNPSSLRDLSLRYELRDPETDSSSQIPSETRRLPYHNFSHSEKVAFQQLVHSLSVIRLSGVQLDWVSITFTTRLSKLRLQSIMLGNEADAWACLKAIATAAQLQDLQIISVVTVPGGEADLVDVDQVQIRIPGLKSLLLEDLTYNTLAFFQKHIFPGSHCVTLSMTEVSKRASFFAAGKVRLMELEFLDLRHLLKDTSIHALHLHAPNNEGTEWISKDEIRSLLESLLDLKTLRISNSTFRTGDWAALTKPERGRFSKLVTLSLICADISDTDRIKDLVKSHSIRRMELGGFLSGHNSGRAEGVPYIQYGDEIVDWLAANVPEFHLYDPTDGPPELDEENWQLW